MVDVQSPTMFRGRVGTIPGNVCVPRNDALNQPGHGVVPKLTWLNRTSFGLSLCEVPTVGELIW